MLRALQILTSRELVSAVVVVWVLGFNAWRLLAMLRKNFARHRVRVLTPRGPLADDLNRRAEAGSRPRLSSELEANGLRAGPTRASEQQWCCGRLLRSGGA